MKLCDDIQQLCQSVRDQHITTAEWVEVRVSICRYSIRERQYVTDVMLERLNYLMDTIDRVKQ